ncbi:hypothetical protein [Thauera aromatica]|uniref:hypothetical protein n=1 Tax=Thauera aromatica TaxID=59405 RepID=UPI001FFD4A12|nr:hypothetical protein [Thauera aromatica]MCK2095661.1 hypothetical protein [Thauera aromatica]
MMPAPFLLSLAQQVRAAGLAAQQARAERVRGQITAARSTPAVVRANRLRHALLALLADGRTHTARGLAERMPAHLRAGLSALSGLLQNMRERGWTATDTAPDRRGLRVGQGRAHHYCITLLGREALAEFERTSPLSPTGDH